MSDPSEVRILRVFISSPGDVGAEREVAADVICRLNDRYRGQAKIDPYFWEHEPHFSSVDFTSSIGPAADYDVVIVILWKRLGSRVHASHLKADGGRYESGTEYEVVTALEAREQEPVGLPELAIFVNKTKPQIVAGTATAKEELSQFEKLQNFIARTLRQVEDDGSVVNQRAYSPYATLDRFEELLGKMLDAIITTRVGAGSVAPMEGERIWQENPYRGLDVFDFEHKSIFFAPSC